ncbi:MAG TPA: hypothetical protein PLU35_07120 [Phycisphaerales bacterium]|nr:hypothetical protein [Phycisphaerales bacterium]
MTAAAPTSTSWNSPGGGAGQNRHGGLFHPDNPRWFPDGERFAFNGGVGGFSDGIYVFDLNSGAPPTKISPSGNYVLPDVSPDGLNVAFQEVYGGMYTVGSFGEEFQQLTGYSAHVRWSPKGTKLAYSNWASGGDRTDLFIYDLVAGAEKQITNAASGHHFIIADWSPDGLTLLATLRTPDGYEDILVLDLAGTILANLTNTPNQSEGGATWSPDGRFIVYVGSTPDGATDLFAMKPDGTGKTNLTNSAGVREALAHVLVRSPCPADFNHDGEINSLDFIAFLNAYTAGCD